MPDLNFENLIKFYLPKGQINDATAYYINLIKNAFLSSNFKVATFDKNDFEIKDSDYVVVVSCWDFLSIYRKNRKAKIIIWFQGLLPEENKMLMGASLNQKLRFLVYNWMEKKTINKSHFNFFVSATMHKHYRGKYSYNDDNFMIIPCYNKNLNNAYFSSNIKPKSSFVYAGGIFPWQCFNETVAIYKEIEKNNTDAFLTILTKDQEKAKEIIEREGVKNYEIKYVGLNEVMDELGKHKYGFLLREDNIVNNCATPTKMNTYLSAGLIPIHTYAVHSFNENLNLEGYEIKVKLEDGKTKLAEKILMHDGIQINYDEYHDVCTSNFKDYFDDTYHINKIKSEVISKIINN